MTPKHTQKHQIRYFQNTLRCHDELWFSSLECNSSIPFLYRLGILYMCVRIKKCVREWVSECAWVHACVHKVLFSSHSAFPKISNKSNKYKDNLIFSSSNTCRQVLSWEERKALLLQTASSLTPTLNLVLLSSPLPLPPPPPFSPSGKETVHLRY